MWRFPHHERQARIHRKWSVWAHPQPCGNLLKYTHTEGVFSPWSESAHEQDMRHLGLKRTMLKHTEIYAFWRSPPHGRTARIFEKCTVLTCPGPCPDIRKYQYSGHAPAIVGKRESLKNATFWPHADHAQTYENIRILAVSPALCQSVNLPSPRPFCYSLIPLCKVYPKRENSHFQHGFNLTFLTPPTEDVKVRSTTLRMRRGGGPYP